MVREFEIYRAILQRIEETPTPNCTLNAKDLAPYPEQEVAYHMRLLDRKGMIEAKIIDRSDGSNLIGRAVARRLTDAGHDFLDSMRNDTLWSKIKAHFKERSVDMTIDLVVPVGKRLAEAMLS